MPRKAKTQSITATAGCKININLRITGRRADGYHILDSLFLPLPFPCDTLFATRVEKEGLVFSCSDPALEHDSNIVVKAYDAFAKATGNAVGLAVALQKKIPYGAGLGGGSSDAAALLLLMNAMAQNDNSPTLSTEELQELAVGLGADVPFFLKNRPARATGIGDRLEEIDNPLSGMHLVLVCPKVMIATAWAFSAWDKKNAKERSIGLTSRQEHGSSPLVRGICVQNDLRQIVFEEHPQLAEFAAELNACKAEVAGMSGSGSAIFGLFSQEVDAANAVCLFQKKGERVFHHIL